MLPLSKRVALKKLIERYDRMMHLSRHGMEFIADWEGLRLRMYDDGGQGIGNCTIGIGHLIHTGPCDGRASELPFKNGITKDQAFFMFETDAQRFVDLVNRMVKVPLTQNQFDALVDFSFNTGGGYPEVWQTVNANGDVAAVLLRTAILPAWATSALRRRRAAEGKLYNTPDAPGEEEDDMKVASWWTNRELTEGKGEINLHVDFGPAKVYDLRLVLQAENTGGSINFQHGQLPFVDCGGFAQTPQIRTASFQLIPGQYGTAPFEVKGKVKIAYLACAGRIA